jgi:hypothetical protein
MANLTTNVDIDYIQKDYTSTVDALISYANINYGPGTSANRLWTNFNQDSFSRTWLEIVAYVSDVLYFYLDNQATESYLQTATVRSSVELIAKQFGFVPASATSASGKASFTCTSSIPASAATNYVAGIPRGTKLLASNGQLFFTTNDKQVPAAGVYDINVIQGEYVSEQFVAEGLQNEEFELRSSNVIRDLDNLNPADISPQVTISGNGYTLVPTLIRSNGTDSPAIKDSLGDVIGGGGRVFLLDIRADGTPYISFGDGIFGRKLQPGETVSINYRTGGGTAGNVAQNTLTTLLSNISQVSSVTNNAEFSGGADEQSIEQLRELIPASLRILDRAVAEQDYSDILTTKFSEVFAASTEINTEDAGVDLNIYVVPQGLGIPQISDNTLLKNKLTSYIDRRKTVTVQFKILDAFGVDTVFTLEVFISDTASRSVVTAAIKTALLDYFNLSTGGPQGSGIGFAEPILLKDITNIVEAISGVVRFEIKRQSYKPRVDKKVIGLLTEYVNSEVTIFPNISESEWLLAAAGLQPITSGVVIYNNTALTSFSYNSTTGVIQYSLPVDLSLVAPGDQFRDGANVDFSILAVNTINNNVTITAGLSVVTTIANSNHGSIRTGTNSYESYKVYKKILAKATNLSVNSLTDNNLDLSVISSNGSSLGARVLLDNTKVFLPNQYSTGQFYLVDSSSNIWEIVFNDSNTIKVGLAAVNDAAITTVAAGAYKIVTKMTSYQITFQNSIFNIQYNSHNTLFSIGGEFNQIGTIGDGFTVAKLQSNKGTLGVSLDLLSYDTLTKKIQLNGSPDMLGINSEYVIVDSSGQILNVVGVDNKAQPATFYDTINMSSNFTLKGSGLGSFVAQGFKVPSTSVYAAVTFYLKREGNILGNLVAKIVADNGSGLPDLGTVLAASNSKVVSSISDSANQKVVFSFVAPPTLTAATQYHLVLTTDAAYQSAQLDGVTIFDNTSLVNFSYNVTYGTVQYASAVNLSSVLPGHYFRSTLGNLFKILAVNDSSNTVTLAPGMSLTEFATPVSSADGSVIQNDRILVGIDNTSPTYTDGKFSRFNGSLWSDDIQGPSPSGTSEDMVFYVEGTKSITIESNLTPVMGVGATLSKRYYDDSNEISLILGVTSGIITSATNVNALGKGTVSGVPNRNVDRFVFRSSGYADDVVNLRKNEIPQLKESDIDIRIVGGID